ncbi:hypothetical protein GCM10023189_60850 [Nibrella saemangeumensis]|uniref:Peptidase C14 caspase domain-containing protein n=1 Tax=Nibrella saemangeumensis TaxID=1084526 RepID=A0ABP8NTH7_9BACT
MKTVLFFLLIGVSQVLTIDLLAQQKHPLGDGYIPLPYADTAVIDGESKSAAKGKRTNRMIFAIDLKNEKVEVGDTIVTSVVPISPSSVKNITIITQLCYENCSYLRDPYTGGYKINGYGVDTARSGQLPGGTYYFPIKEQNLITNDQGNQIVLDNSTLSTIYVLFVNNYMYEATVSFTVTVRKKVENKLELPFARERIVPSLANARYHALLIGVNEYDDPNLRLKRPAVDLARLDSVLTNKYAFASITTLLDPSKKKVIDVLTNLAYSLVNDDNLLIYYAGHSVANSGNGFWALRDSKIDDYDSFLSITALSNIIAQMRMQQVLLVADACYGASIIRSLTSLPEDRVKTWKELYNQPGRKAISSSVHEKVPDKSTFIDYFVKGLLTNEDYLSAEQLYDGFKFQVYNKSSTNQKPVYGDIDGVTKSSGDFIFKVKSVADSAIALKRYTIAKDTVVQQQYALGMDPVELVRLDQTAAGDTTRSGIENYANRSVTLVNTYKGNVTVQVALKDLPASQRTISIPPNKTKILDLGKYPAATVTVKADDNPDLKYQLQQGMRYQIKWLADSGQLDLFLVR